MFFQDLAAFGDKLAVIEPEQQLTYRQLASQADQLLSNAGRGKQLIFLLAENTIASLVAYLASLRGGHCLMLLDPGLAEDKLQKLVDAYQPNMLIEKGQVKRLGDHQLALDPQVSLLLSTSGTTGSAKQVALSADNLQANAASICAYLPIQEADKTLLTLPMFYAYGLSVINSHLFSGACLLFSPHSPVNRAFWDLLKERKINSLSGVPHSYEMLLRLGLTGKDLPALRYFTQAGGKLPAEQVTKLADYAKKSNKAFFVMYGQTEATARMAYLPPHKALEKPDSIGQPIPGGEFVLRDQKGDLIDQAGVEGELFFQGPNVMLGYVTCAQELADLHSGPWLATGDLAYRDAQGDYFISGRKKRMLKLFGERVSLDQIEADLAEQALEAYCCGVDDKLLVAVKNPVDEGGLKRQLSQSLRLHPSALSVLGLDVLPVNANGKKDYAAVLQMAGWLHG